MAGTILGARSELDIKLGQVPITIRPELRDEMQEIYNALHILNQYVIALSAEIEGTDTGTPDQNIPFIRRFSATAKQDIVAGNIISPGPGGYYKGVLTYGHKSGGGAPSNPGTELRAFFGIKALNWAVALSDAAIGERVLVGASSGVIKVTGAKSGQIVWAKDSRSFYTLVGMTNGTAGPEQIVDLPYLGDGLMYLLNPNGSIPVSSIYYNYEGVYLPGYPYRSGDYVHKNRVFFFPVGICVRDDYVYINDFVDDTPPKSGGLL